MAWEDLINLVYVVYKVELPPGLKIGDKREGSEKSIRVDKKETTDEQEFLNKGSCK